MAKPKAGVLTHGEIIDVNIVMDKLVSVSCDRGLNIELAVVKLDTGRTITLKHDEDTGYEVSLGSA